MSCEFLQELTESRLIRQVDRIEGRTISQLGHILFNHLLALRVLHYESPEAAARYAKAIMDHQHFMGFRISSPDIYNLVVFIQNKDRFADRLQIDSALTVPEMRLRRNLRELSSRKLLENDYEGMMLILQRRLAGVSSAQMQLRRETANYQKLNKTERGNVMRRLMLLIRDPIVFSDLHMRLRDIARKNGYIV